MSHLFPFLSVMFIFHCLSFCFYFVSSKRIFLTALYKFLLLWGKKQKNITRRSGGRGGEGDGNLKKLAREGLIKLTFGKL